MTASQPTPRIGSQQPRLSSVPLFISSLGQDAIDLAAHAGLILDPWQQLVLEHSLNLRAGGKWSAMEVGLIVPRQNGKGAIIEARQLAAMFLTRDPEIIYSAHQMKTSKKMYARIKKLCQQTPDLNRLVKDRYRQSNETMGIELDWGMLQFVARKGGSGRGFTGNTLFFDEAYDLDPDMLADLIPALAAVKNAQVWYVSSAGMESSEALAKIRARGIEGDRFLAFFEWSADHGVDLDGDDDALYACNPSLGLHLDYEYIRTVERGQMDDERFGRERFGLWKEPTKVETVIDPNQWAAMTNTKPKRIGPIAIAVDASPDCEWWTVAAAQRTDDGKIHLEAGFHRQASRSDVAKYVISLVRKWKPCAVVIDRKSPAMTLERELINAKIEPETTTAAQLVTACAGFYTDATQGDLSHVGDEVLAGAIEGATKRNVSGGGWAWNRVTDTVISPLVAATLARWGLIEFGALAKPPTQMPTQRTATARIETNRLMTAAF